MTEKVRVQCPVCESGACTVFCEPWNDIADPAKLYGAASGVRGTQRLVRCRVCGMVYENPRFPEEVILRGYESSQESGHDSQYPMRVESFFRGLKATEAHLPPKGSRVLDIGTAGGAFLEAAQRFGFQVVGLEPSRFLVEQGRQRGLPIEQGTVDQHPFSHASFDLICFWDVLEHLAEPRRALEKVLPLLKRDGVLLINYPDIGTAVARIAGRRFWWLLSVHLHHFSLDTISRICDRTGFRVFHAQRYWQALQFGYLEDMAIHLGVPLSGLLKKLTPAFLQRLPLPYYASQTTVLARVRS